MREQKGFTLVEVMVGSVILVVALVGLIGLYLSGFDLQETSNSTTVALQAARAKLEEIRNCKFADIRNTYNNQISDIDGLSGKLRVEVSNVIPAYILNIRIIAGWRQHAGRIVGEVTFDAAGNFVSFTDLNGNGKIESPVELESAIAKTGE